MADAMALDTVQVVICDPGIRTVTLSARIYLTCSEPWKTADVLSAASGRDLATSIAVLQSNVGVFTASDLHANAARLAQMFGVGFLVALPVFGAVFGLRLLLRLMRRG